MSTHCRDSPQAPEGHQYAGTAQQRDHTTDSGRAQRGQLPHVMRALATEMPEHWIEATRYLNMDLLKEHKQAWHRATTAAEHAFKPVALWIGWDVDRRSERLLGRDSLGSGPQGGNSFPPNSGQLSEITVAELDAQHSLAPQLDRMAPSPDAEQMSRRFAPAPRLTPGLSTSLSRGERCARLRNAESGSIDRELAIEALHAHGIRNPYSRA